MIETANMTDEEFERHALSILGRELGADGVARFLRIYRAGSGDYTRDRHLWLEKATIQDIMAEAEQGGRRELGREQGLRTSEMRQFVATSGALLNCPSLSALLRARSAYNSATS